GSVGQRAVHQATGRLAGGTVPWRADLAAGARSRLPADVAGPLPAGRRGPRPRRATHRRAGVAPLPRRRHGVGRPALDGRGVLRRPRPRRITSPRALDLAPRAAARRPHRGLPRAAGPRHQAPGGGAVVREPRACGVRRGEAPGHAASRGGRDRHGGRGRADDGGGGEPLRARGRPVDRHRARPTGRRAGHRHERVAAGDGHAAGVGARRRPAAPAVQRAGLHQRREAPRLPGPARPGRRRGGRVRRRRTPHGRQPSPRRRAGGAVPRPRAGVLRAGRWRPRRPHERRAPDAPGSPACALAPGGRAVLDPRGTRVVVGGL
ncbi:MAG: hypothetical protein AVDCRST_MAG06-1601, partial [uncultured Nocardioides sp.]